MFNSKLSIRSVATVEFNSSVGRENNTARSRFCLHKLAASQRETPNMELWQKAGESERFQSRLGFALLTDAETGSLSALAARFAPTRKKMLRVSARHSSSDVRASPVSDFLPRWTLTHLSGESLHTHPQTPNISGNNTFRKLTFCTDVKRSAEASYLVKDADGGRCRVTNRPDAPVCQDQFRQGSAEIHDRPGAEIII